MDGLASRASMIRLSLQPSPASETSAFNNIRAFSSRRAGNQRLKLLALYAAQPHNIPLYRNLLRKHPCLHRQIVAMAANHQILSNWLKRRLARRDPCDSAGETVEKGGKPAVKEAGQISAQTATTADG
jgi:hypothetical protein